MIILTLLHPLQSVPIQSWTFHDKSSIKIGRATNNEVVLYNAVVSRDHLEIRKLDREWEMVNLSSNGTYVDGKRIEQAKITDGMVVRLANSGPKILIKIESKTSEDRPDSDKQLTAKGLSKKVKNTLIHYDRL